MLTDASWDGTKRTGTAFFCFDAEGELLHTHTGHTTCEDPFDAEAQAMIEVLHYIKEAQHTPATICSDGKNLVEAINKNEVINIPSWRAAEKAARSSNTTVPRNIRKCLHKACK